MPRPMIGIPTRTISSEPPAEKQALRALMDSIATPNPSRMARVARHVAGSSGDRRNVRRGPARPLRRGGQVRAAGAAAHRRRRLPIPVVCRRGVPPGRRASRRHVPQPAPTPPTRGHRRSRAATAPAHAPRSAAWSRTRPSRMRTTRSQASPTSASWVTRMNVWPCSRLNRRRSARTSAERSESRLPVGSSARISDGRLTSARAIAARCCSPPESSAGRWSPRPASPTRSSASPAAALAADAPDPGVVAGEHHVLERGQRRDQVEVLEDEAHLAGPDAGPLALAQGHHVAAVEGQLGARAVVQVGRVEQAQDVHERALARSGRAHDRDHLARARSGRPRPAGLRRVVRRPRR